MDVFLIEVPMFQLSLVKVGQIGLVKNRPPPSWISKHGLFDDTDVFLIKVTIILLNLVMIGQIINKWQLFFEIQHGGDHYLEFFQIGISDINDVF